MNKTILWRKMESNWGHGSWRLNICSQPDPLSKGGHNLHCIIGNCIISDIGATVTIIQQPALTLAWTLWISTRFAKRESEGYKTIGMICSTIEVSLNFWLLRFLIYFCVGRKTSPTKSLLYVLRMGNHDQDKSNFLLGNTLRRLSPLCFCYFTAMTVFYSLDQYKPGGWGVFWEFFCCGGGLVWGCLFFWLVWFGFFLVER